MNIKEIIKKPSFTIISPLLSFILLFLIMEFEPGWNIFDEMWEKFFEMIYFLTVILGLYSCVLNFKQKKNHTLLFSVGLLLNGLYALTFVLLETIILLGIHA